MKKILLFFLFFFCFVSSSVYAHGGLTHMFIAYESIALLPDATLRNLLLSNLDAYLVGAYYPDSGYINGAKYGEDSHWDPFIYAFADYIKETYPSFTTENPKLVAFLFGCAVHRMSDEIGHQTFYKYVASNDFKGDEKKAESYSDPGLDLLINIDKSQWFSAPKTWWIPVKDLLAVYHRMGKDEYTAKEIRWGTSVLSLAGFGERLIAAPGYPYLRWKMPWTASHYYTWPEGGIRADELITATYLTSLWLRLHIAKPELPVATQHASYVIQSHLTEFAETLLQNGIVNINVTENSDGSILLDSPTIAKPYLFKAQLVKLTNKMFAS